MFTVIVSLIFMARRRSVLRTPGSLPSGTPVQQWNMIAEDTVVASGAFQNRGTDYMAYVSGRGYDAVTAIEGGYEPYAAGIARTRAR